MGNIPRVARRNAAGVQAGLQPRRALLRAAVCPGLGVRRPLVLRLQAVVANGLGRLEGTHDLVSRRGLEVGVPVEGSGVVDAQCIHTPA